MGKQINFYLNQKDIEEIEKYLIKRTLIFIKDNILLEQNPVYANHLYEDAYIVFPNTDFHYRSWEEEGKLKYRLQAINSSAMEFSIFGKSDQHYRARFFYDSDGHKNAKFETAVARFFRWFRRKYTRVPASPFFFHNPNFPIKELF